MNYLWFYIIILGVSLLILNIFIIYYPPFTIFSLGIISVGLASYGVNLVDKKNDKINLIVDNLYRNLELIFSYYGKDGYYRVFVPSSLGYNGMLLLDTFPVKIEKVNNELINHFNDAIGIFLETPGSLIIEEMRKMGINFSETLEFLLKKALIDLYDFANDLEVNFIDDKLIQVKIYGPNPNKQYGILGYVQSLIVASIIAENLSKIVYIESQTASSNVLDLKIHVI
ncbi:hypothetical protein V6M85_02385 [Sulfolobus tengchongensis]|uniref:Uncharacterized protein n=1 Tax=Sulfolobus tengchongensis TaxID=207809 RepID=A0AAX4L1E9_9CREN